MAASTSLSLFSRLFPPRSTPPRGIGFSSQLFLGASRVSPFFLQSPPSRSSSAVFSRRRRNSSNAPRKESPSNLKRTVQDDEEVDDDIDEDAFEALFSQLEEDLKNDNSPYDDADDEITEEDLARLEQELVEALGDEDDEASEDALPGSDISNLNEETEEIESPKLKNWQVRRLARALKIGKRKTSIKSLAAELGLDRALVLELLRDPPPNLLLMSASLPDEVAQMPSEESEPNSVPIESPNSADETDVLEKEAQVKVPVHAKQTRWSAQKRLKKVQIETLERVYSRTKRPTNAMVSSIVHVTNLPSKRIVKWFEDKRLEDGVPDRHGPFRRSTPETISTS